MRETLGTTKRTSQVTNKQKNTMKISLFTVTLTALVMGHDMAGALRIPPVSVRSNHQNSLSSAVSRHWRWHGHDPILQEKERSPPLPLYNVTTTPINDYHKFTRFLWFNRSISEVTPLSWVKKETGSHFGLMFSRKSVQECLQFICRKDMTVSYGRCHA